MQLSITVQTIIPRTVGSLNTYKAYTNGWKSVFYRLVSENGMPPASSGKPSLLESKTGQ